VQTPMEASSKGATQPLRFTWISWWKSKSNGDDGCFHPAMHTPVPAQPRLCFTVLHKSTRPPQELIRGTHPAYLGYTQKRPACKKPKVPASYVWGACIVQEGLCRGWDVQKGEIVCCWMPSRACHFCCAYLSPWFQRATCPCSYQTGVGQL